MSAKFDISIIDNNTLGCTRITVSVQQRSRLPFRASIT